MEQNAEDENKILVQLAEGLNSDLNDQQEIQLAAYDKMNSVMNVLGSGEMLIVVGSCLEGSKVNTPLDNGDIDVLIVAGNVELYEKLFEYVPGYPAFLTVPITGEHSKIFSNMKPDAANCLPASVLQKMNKDKFNVIKFFTNADLIPKRGFGNIRLVKQSAVGFESKTVFRVPSDSDEDETQSTHESLAHDELSLLTAFCRSRIKFKNEIRNEIEQKKKTSVGATAKDESKLRIEPAFAELCRYLNVPVDKCEGLAECDGDKSERDCSEPRADAFSIAIIDKDDSRVSDRMTGKDEDKLSIDQASAEHCCLSSVTTYKRKGLAECEADKSERDCFEPGTEAFSKAINEQGDSKTSDGATGKDENKLRIGKASAFSIYKCKGLAECNGNKFERDCFEPGDTFSIAINEQIDPKEGVKAKKGSHGDDLEPWRNASQTDTFCNNDKQSCEKDAKASSEIDVSAEYDDKQVGTSGSFLFDFERNEIADENATEECASIESADFVPAFKFSGWPRVAEDWKYRERKWPSLDVIEEVLKTSCQIIVKPLPDKVNDDGSYTPTNTDNTFRLSFASQELILARSLNKTQLTCWKILKAFQKSCFETTPRVMTSYLWKNAIFWISEKTDPLFWKPENTLRGTIKALNFTLKCLKDGFFPQYFVKNMNLIKHCSAVSVEKAVALIEMLRKEPVSQLRQFFECPPLPNPLEVTSTDIGNLRQGMDKNHQVSLLEDDISNFMRLVLSNVLANPGNTGRLLEGWLNILDELIGENETMNTTDESQIIFLASIRECIVTKLRDPSHDSSVLLNRLFTALKNFLSSCDPQLLESQMESEQNSRPGIFYDSSPDKEQQSVEFELD